MRDFLRVVVMVWTILCFVLTVYYVYQPFALLLVPIPLITSSTALVMIRTNIVDFGLLWLVIVAPALAMFAIWPERSTRAPAPPTD